MPGAGLPAPPPPPKNPYEEQGQGYDQGVGYATAPAGGDYGVPAGHDGGYSDVPIGGDYGQDPSGGNSAPNQHGMDVEGQMQNKSYRQQANDKAEAWFYKIPIPVNYFGTFTAVWMIVGAILNIIFGGVGFGQVCIDVYLMFFGSLLLAVLFPAIPYVGGCMVRLRNSIERWAAFMSTHWGRGWLFIFTAFLCFSHSSVIRILMGIFVVVTGILYVWCGRLAAMKYNRIREYVAMGHEGDQLHITLEDKGRAIAGAKGIIDADAMKGLAEEAGRELNRSELHAIFALFDNDRDGEVSVDRFVECFSHKNNVSLKSL